MQAIRHCGVRGFGGGIDRLDVTIPRFIQATAVVREYERRVRISQTSWDYEAQLDLTPIGMSAHVYLRSRHTGNHKVELLRAGAMLFTEMVSTIERVFDIAAADLHINRVDLFADVHDVPVSKFRRTSYMRFKRIGTEYNKGAYRIDGSGCESLRFGRQPNVLRVYDKNEELKSKGRHESAPSDVVTRVERGFGAGRIPPLLRTIRSVEENALTFNPFDGLEILSEPDPRTECDQLCKSALLRLKCEGWKGLVGREGVMTARKKLSRLSHGNLKRFLAPVINCPRKRNAMITTDDLLELYRNGVTEQFGSAGDR